MTQLGGVEVQRFAADAGFRDLEVKQAATVAYVISRWRDHHQIIDGISRDLDEWGLFGLAPSMLGDVNPSDLFHPDICAAQCRVLFIAHGGTWDWHPAARRDGGTALPRAYQTLTKTGLFRVDAAHMPPMMTLPGTRSPHLDTSTIMASASPRGTGY